MSLKMQLAARLREAIKEHGLSEADVARLSGKSPTTINRWCDGWREPALDDLAATVETFDHRVRIDILPAEEAHQLDRLRAILSALPEEERGPFLTGLEAALRHRSSSRS